MENCTQNERKSELKHHISSCKQQQVLWVRCTTECRVSLPFTIHFPSEHKPPQHAERLICLRESNTKLGPLSAPSCLGNHSAIKRLFFFCTDASSMAVLFTTGWSCNPCHLPIAAPSIPLEKNIQPPRESSPLSHTRCTVSRREQQGDSYHGNIDSYLFRTPSCSSTGELCNVNLSRRSAGEHTCADAEKHTQSPPLHTLEWTNCAFKGAICIQIYSICVHVFCMNTCMHEGR